MLRGVVVKGKIFDWKRKGEGVESRIGDLGSSSRGRAKELLEKMRFAEEHRYEDFFSIKDMNINKI